MPSDIIHNSFAENKNIEKVVENNDKYRGRELPGFINYKIFEELIREQIKVLEEPAINMLNKISGLYCFVNFTFPQFLFL